MKKQINYCIRRGRAKNCKKITYNKDRICSSCMAELEEIAEDLNIINKLNLNIKVGINEE